MVKRILALSLLMVVMSACGGQEDPAGEIKLDAMHSEPYINGTQEPYNR